MTSIVRYLVSSIFWSTVARIGDAVIRFITIPLLLHAYGKSEFGVLGIALAANAFVQIFDLGMNTGLVKYYSEWIRENASDKIEGATRAAYTLYLLIGVVNSAVLVVAAWKADTLFNIDKEDANLLRTLLLLLAISAVPNWYTAVGNQLLVADRQTAFVQKITALRNVALGLVVVMSATLKLSIINYFVAHLVVTQAFSLIFLIRAKTSKLVYRFTPSLDLRPIVPIIRYCTAIFAIGLFQISALQSRPLILGMFSADAGLAVAEYRVMEVFPLLVTSIGSMIIGILLPLATQAVREGNTALKEGLGYLGTRAATVVLAAMCLPLIVCARDLLVAFAGPDFAQREQWLAGWCVIVVLAQHINPLSSLLLAGGRIAPLIVSSAVSCACSIAANAMLADTYGVGSSVIGYGIYITLQLIFYYSYAIPKFIALNPLRVLGNFASPFAIAAAVGVVAHHFFLPLLDQGLIRAIAGGLLTTLLYALCILLLNYRHVRTALDMWKGHLHKKHAQNM